MRCVNWSTSYIHACIAAWSIEPKGLYSRPVFSYWYNIFLCNYFYLNFILWIIYDKAHNSFDLKQPWANIKEEFYSHFTDQKIERDQNHLSEDPQAISPEYLNSCNCSPETGPLLVPTCHSAWVSMRDFIRLRAERKIQLKEEQN